MIITDGKSELAENVRTRIVIGKFDGIHAGHKKLIRTITEKNDALKSVVFTFTHSSDFFADSSDRILSDEDRRAKFEKLGADYLVEYELNRETAAMEPEEFACEILKKRLHCEELVCGSDLSFGHMGRGNIEMLREMEPKLHIKVTVIDKVKYQGEDISSTRIRKALSEGQTIDAENMLG